MRGSSPAPGFYGGGEASEGPFGHFIPGFPINDDTKSIRTTASGGRRNESASKVIRRIRGQGTDASRAGGGVWLISHLRTIRLVARVLDG